METSQPQAKVETVKPKAIITAPQSEKKENTNILTSEHIQSLGVSKGISDTIITECNKAPDFNHCVKSVLGVANAESGLFTKCSVTKNCH